MRRVATFASVLSLLTASLAGIGSVATTTVADAAQSTTVWQLVNRTCTGNEVEAGRACFDPAGHADGWNSVNERSADGKVNGEKQDYTYQLPDAVAPGNDNRIKLTAEVSQVSDGGEHARMCVS